MKTMKSQEVIRVLEEMQSDLDARLETRGEDGEAIGRLIEYVIEKDKLENRMCNFLKEVVSALEDKSKLSIWEISVLKEAKEIIKETEQRISKT